MALLKRWLSKATLRIRSRWRCLFPFVAGGMREPQSENPAHWRSLGPRKGAPKSRESGEKIEGEHALIWQHPTLRKLRALQQVVAQCPSSAQTR